ncbi:MAG TPA: heme-binding protein [Acidobacteriota bacterium]|nr:heme-binding protein [Acidobacteriota bacterium]
MFPVLTNCPLLLASLCLLGVIFSPLAAQGQEPRTWRPRPAHHPLRTPDEPPRSTLTCDAPIDPQGLTADEIRAVAETGAAALSGAYSVAVTDRAGRILAVWQKPGSSLEDAERAVALARTGAFFSNDQAPLSSRTVRFISQKNFPPGVDFLPNGALYGIENTNRGCSFNRAFNPGQCVPRATSLSALRRRNNVDGICNPADPGCDLLRCDGDQQDGCGLGIFTGKFQDVQAGSVQFTAEEALDSFPQRVHGGGIPIFKDCRLVGGVGVFGGGAAADEFAALAASQPGLPGLGVSGCLLPPFAVFLDGIRLPFVEFTSPPPGTSPGSLEGGFLALDQDAGGDPVFIRESRAAAEDWLIGGPGLTEDGMLLSASEVERIVEQSIAGANETRAAIRLPLGSRTRMVIAVADLDGRILALFRMSDATVFSIDVAVAKARNMIYFSGPDRTASDLPGVPAGTAVTSRTISFGSQPFYPVGITGSAPGPFFELYLNDLTNPCSQGADPSTGVNGIVFFPGSVPLYKDGVLVGGLGISGDGVEQDDVVAAAGAAGFEAPFDLRADLVFVRGVRLPYLKFNRNPDK